MRLQWNRSTTAAAVLAVLAASGIAVWGQGGSGQSGQSGNNGVVARGGGVTIVQGGAGPSAGFMPVITKIAFHAERSGNQVVGAFECLALAPTAPTGAGSGDFTVNAMYVTGTINSAAVTRESTTLMGTATITGLGAGTNVPFTFTFRQGGPGATAVLVTEGSPRLTFNEILLEGEFSSARSF
jgi:hypothetical protein